MHYLMREATDVSSDISFLFLSYKILDLHMWERILLAYANKSDVAGAEKVRSLISINNRNRINTNSLSFRLIHILDTRRYVVCMLLALLRRR